MAASKMSQAGEMSSAMSSTKPYSPDGPACDTRLMQREADWRPAAAGSVAQHSDHTLQGRKGLGFRV